MGLKLAEYIHCKVTDKEVSVTDMDPQIFSMMRFQCFRMYAFVVL